MKVATWNIHRGRGMAGRFRPERIISVIAEIDPDIIALQEAQHYLRRGVPMLDAAQLLEETGLMPVSVAQQPSHQGWRSNVLLIRKGRWSCSGARGLQLGGWEPRGAIAADLEHEGQPLRVLCGHFSLSSERRRLQAEALLTAVAGEGKPTLLLGDFNESRDGGSALKVFGRHFRAPPAMPTFPAFRPIWALDRIFIDPFERLHELQVHNSAKARRASDHLPLTARLG